MARPKLGESETQRLQLKITENEITAIDDWRFANRISSRSEAVRRLVQIGLLFEQKRPELFETLEGYMADEVALSDEIERFRERTMAAVSEEHHAADIPLLEASNKAYRERLRMWLTMQEIIGTTDIYSESEQSLNDIKSHVEDMQGYFIKLQDKADRRGGRGKK